VPHIGSVPGEVGGVAYGVRYNSDEDGNFDYLCAVEAADFSKLPAELARLRIPARRYAVFEHRDHVSTNAEPGAPFAASGSRSRDTGVVDAPELERYAEGFDSRMGWAGIEIWIPISS
jgi:AraC family transcriptional regulator